MWPPPPKLMATPEDAAKGLPEMMELVRQGEEYDAFIVACHSDPNLEVLQAITDKPVVGIAEASMKIASMNCHSFAVISLGLPISPSGPWPGSTCARTSTGGRGVP